MLRGSKQLTGSQFSGGEIRVERASPKRGIVSRVPGVKQYKRLHSQAEVRGGGVGHFELKTLGASPPSSVMSRLIPGSFSPP